MGRKGKSGIGSGKYTAASIGNMSKEERSKFLDEAPVGTRITGLVNINSGNEVVVQKESGYQQVYGGVGAGSKINKEYWTVGGSEDPYIKRTLRTAANGTNKYYKVKLK